MCSEIIETHGFVPPFSLSCSCCLHSCSLFTSPPTSCTPQNMGAAVLNIPYELVQPTFIGSVNPPIIPGISITCSSNGTTDERDNNFILVAVSWLHVGHKEKHPGIFSSFWLLIRRQTMCDLVSEISVVSRLQSSTISNNTLISVKASENTFMCFWPLL